ncbi:MAG: 1-deoxy-D-xylulose-5-phosphate reductoisomerase [Bauldia sp.]|nr:1-deoxy-D-xylulose-5-phosphate reductoisomerase [Bauldia sp.]
MVPNAGHLRLEQAGGTSASPRRITLLGATGSIGASTIAVVRERPADFAIETVTANRDAARLAELARSVGAKRAVLADAAGYAELKAALAGTDIAPAAGPAALAEAAAAEADIVVAAIVGAAGLAPTLAAVEAGRTVALANKECLVCAGALFSAAAKRRGVQVLPVDSEHNAIFQAMGSGARTDVRRVILTASGGPFRTTSKEALRSVTREQALKHPNWSMGQKITIDSATLMNKGLELIEAHHLFGTPPSELEVLVHPQSVIHGLVEFRDGSVIAALAMPDMRVPIAHCLAWPDRLDGPCEPLDLAKVATLSFEEPDMDRFPALALARHAMETGRGAPTVLNAANEVAVAEFLADRISFLGIAALVEATLEAAERGGLLQEPATVEHALELDRAGRAHARALLPQIAAKRS